MNEVDWRDRLICIKGARGAGKTTLMRQRVKEAFGEDSRKALYVSLDDLWFAKHRVKDLVEYLYEHGYTPSSMKLITWGKNGRSSLRI